MKIVKPGMNTLIITNTHLGMQKYGVPVAGPMDAKAAHLANWLVGNHENSPLLEITFTGPTIEFIEPCQIAITGATSYASINSISISNNETIDIAKGDILDIGKLKEGTRAYLAIKGNWKPLKTQSNYKNYQLRKSDMLSIIQPNKFINQRKASRDYQLENQKIVKATPGPEYDKLPLSTRKELQSTIFTLLPESNRMGYRLSPNLPRVNKSIISSGVVPGTLQITPEGLPIILMQDGPTTGGYFRALCVTRENLDKLGQLKPGDSFSFSIP